MLGNDKTKEVADPNDKQSTVFSFYVRQCKLLATVL